MDKNLPESLKEIYRSLPLPIREAIFAPETTDAYDRAQEHHNLTKEQREILSIQCGLLMMGLILPQDLVPILTRELKLPQQKVSLIAQDINREVFNPIKNELKEIHVLDSGRKPRSQRRNPPAPVGVTPQPERTKRSAQADPAQALGLSRRRSRRSGEQTSRHLARFDLDLDLGSVANGSGQDPLQSIERNAVSAP